MWGWCNTVYFRFWFKLLLGFIVWVLSLFARILCWLQGICGCVRGRCGFGWIWFGLAVDFGFGLVSVFCVAGFVALICARVAWCV